MRFDQTVCTDLARASELEWLEANGLGGFASSTITGLNTRRYHGLLTAATKPPVGRVVMLSKLEETLVIDGERFDLSTNQYPGAIHPRGYRNLVEFRLDPFPIFTYRVAGLVIEKRVFMVHGENTTVIEYQLLAPHPNCRLELRPLIAFRDYHSTTHRNDVLDSNVAMLDGLATVMPYACLPALFLAHNAIEGRPTGEWYFNFEYPVEHDRGLDDREDLFQPLLLAFDLAACSTLVIASTKPHDAADAALLRDREITRRAEIINAAPGTDPLIRKLTAAADQFIVQRGELQTIIAGYHWFSDWGRDTMIALPGLTIVTGRYDVARNILRAFAESIDQGMLPNRFPDAGERPEYNTVDATLWFFEAVRAYLRYTEDYDFVREHIYPRLEEVMDWHIRGTRYSIHVDEDGLLYCGEPGVQLTWMDSKIGDWVVTPRTGKPVEIQALWYNALRVMQSLADRFYDDSMELRMRELAVRAEGSFNRLFWNPEFSCLYDVVNGEQRDASIRPNQIFAASLHYLMLSPEKARAVVDVVQRELLTPLGLCSLLPRDSAYRPRYGGGPVERDSAYHQGTVWPWLIGPFLTAYLRVNRHSSDARAQAIEWLRSFEEHLSDAGLGHISELADADYPHRPNGCIAQAWSVAELLRAAVEDVYEISPVREDSIAVAG